MAKVARDVVLLAQTEVGELSEGGGGGGGPPGGAGPSGGGGPPGGAGAGRGGSSTMPHKRNPVAAIAVLACAQRTPGLVATILSAMAQEHQRAVGAWQSEAETLLELVRLTGSAANALRDSLDGLQVDARRMRVNLELTGGLVMSESVAVALARPLGRPRAQALLEQAAQQVATEGRHLREVLHELPEVTAALDDSELDRALAPESYLGVSGELIDRALAAHRGSR
jgi:3-carboxy-cis,cis-muconate cycloisomerase